MDIVLEPAPMELVPTDEKNESAVLDMSGVHDDGMAVIREIQNARRPRAIAQMRASAQASALFAPMLEFRSRHNLSQHIAALPDTSPIPEYIRMLERYHANIWCATCDKSCVRTDQSSLII